MPGDDSWCGAFAGGAAEFASYASAESVCDVVASAAAGVDSSEHGEYSSAEVPSVGVDSLHLGEESSEAASVECAVASEYAAAESEVSDYAPA